MGGFHAALLVGSVASGPVIDAEEADRGRIQRHLEAVEHRLRAADISHLSPEQQRERARNVDRLRAYRQAGVFPRNHAFLGERVPYFIDSSGTLCAVGYLVVESGFREVADEIFEHENNAKLLEMTHPALPGWIEASGLTAQEHAAIQPTYCWCNEEEALVCGSDGKTYANACVAETCAGVEIEHEGPCWSDGTTGWPAPGTSTSDEDDAGPPMETSASDGPENETAGTSGGHESASTGQAEQEPKENVPHEDGDGELRRGCRLGDVPRLPLVLLPFVLLTTRRRSSRCDEAR